MHSATEDARAIATWEDVRHAALILVDVTVINMRSEHTDQVALHTRHRLIANQSGRTHASAVHNRVVLRSGGGSEGE